MYDKKIIVKNTCIMIMDYDYGDCPKLERNFLIYDRVTHSRYEFGSYYDQDNRILYIPKIDIEYVQRVLEEYDSIYHDNESDPVAYIKGGIGLKYPPRNNDQKEALRFMTGAGEYAQYKNSKQLSVCLGTGKGKTYLAIATTTYYEMKSIIITYSVNWLEQWKERILQYTDIEEKDIKMISGSSIMNRILGLKNPPKYKIYLVTHATIKSFASTNGWYAVSEFFKKIEVGLKIIDEAHLNFENISMIDFFTNTFKTYYLTATPARSSDEENIIYGKYFKNVPAITLFDEEEDPHTRYIALKFNSHPNIFDIRECKNQYGLDRNKYTDYLITTDVYPKLLRIIIDLAMKNPGKCLIYIGTNKAIEYTYKWIMLAFPELYGQVGVFTSLVDKAVREQEKEKKIILSTTKSAGAAMDIMGLKMTVVLDEPFKSHVLAQQTLGRTRAEDTFYIECVDMGFNAIKKYFYYKRPIFHKYALSCSDLPMRDDELDYRNETILKSRKAYVPIITWDNKKTSLITWDTK